MKAKKEQVLSLKKEGFEEVAVRSPHEELRLSKGRITVTLYKTGTLLIQGNDKEIHQVNTMLEKTNILPKEVSGLTIGSDESLKGDTFGGIIVAAVKADDKIRLKLAQEGIKDSKQVPDYKIAEMAKKIRETAEYEIISLFPKDYNLEITKYTGVTFLLNKLHHQAYQCLIKHHPEKTPIRHIVDKYPGCTVGHIIETKAEENHIEVAAASILAREEALKQLAVLSESAGFKLPKGSTHVADALKKLKERKVDLSFFVKVDFKNVAPFR